VTLTVAVVDSLKRLTPTGRLEKQTWLSSRSMSTLCQNADIQDIFCLRRCSSWWSITVELPRRRFLPLAASIAALPASLGVAPALDYPAQPVRLIVGFPAGGVTDCLVAPTNAPSEIIDRLYKVIDAALADPKIIARFAAAGSIPKSMAPSDFGKFIAEDTEKWGKVIGADNVEVE
jgi:hypothetical protein